MGLKIPSFFWVFVGLMLAAHAPAQTGNPDPGPRSPEEAAFLLKEGSQATERKDRQQVIRSYTRFVERYPTHSGIRTATLGLVEALMEDGRVEEAERRAAENLNQDWDTPELNRLRAYLAEARLRLKDYLHARLVADELLKSKPTPKQIALARSVRFQGLLEEKQYPEAEDELDRLDEHLKKEPIASYLALLPEFKMTFAQRQCTITHLIKGKTFEDSELLDYFGEKNLCFKASLSEAPKVKNLSTLREWCESFTVLNHEIEKLRIDSFLKEKIRKDLRATFDFSKGIHVELEKCYKPYQPKKSNRKRRLRKKG